MGKETYKKREKKNKIIKNVITVGVVVIIVVLIIISNDDVRNRMASVVGCSYRCSKGYLLDDTTNTCYKEKMQKESVIDAYLLGDVNNNGVIDNTDFNVLRSNISNNEDNTYNFVYDINQDRKINDEDLTELASIISLAKTSGGEPASQYVCPNQEKEEKVKNKRSIQFLITSYELENRNCIVKKTIRTEKKSGYSCR